ncbi:MAG: DUF4837 family protein [Candidatus Latescibacteria bacterium]|nr:DUF4837 family protein [Candidatus Latescibacterota bacterium]
MAKTKNIILILIISMLSLALTCSRDLPSSIGRVRQIIVLSNFKTEIEKEITYTLQRNFYTIQPEPEFLIRYEPLSRFNDFVKFRLIFIIGLIKEEPIQTLLSQYQEKISQDTFGLYSFTNPWASNQKVLVFATTDIKFLDAGLKRYEQRIRKEYGDYILQYMHDVTYARGYKKQVSEQLAEKYNFSVKVPNSFFLNEKFAEHHFVYLVAHNPTRSLFIYSQPAHKELDPASLIAMRDSLTNLFYDKDFVYQELTYAETTSFNNMPALKIVGAWQNNQLVAGGPFVSYCFNKNGRFYFLDGMVFNPGKRKLDNLKQLDAVLNTFKISE